MVTNIQKLVRLVVGFRLDVVPDRILSLPIENFFSFLRSKVRLLT